MADIKEQSAKTATKVSTTIKSKEVFKLPKGSKVESKQINIEVEEIENGYLITKRIEYKYRVPNKDYSDWKSIDKKYYSKTNPVQIEQHNKALADMFEPDSDDF